MIGSRQIPNVVKSKMQKSGGGGGGVQMTIGQKGALMKQDRMILDYGRKNRLSKLVSGGNQGIVERGNPNNLLKKGTQ